MTKVSGTDLSVERATVGDRLLISDVDSCVSVDVGDVPRLIAVLRRLYRVVSDDLSNAADSDGGATTESVSPERAFRRGFEAAFESEFHESN